MQNHKIKAVIFDLGNVLIDFDHTLVAKKVSLLSQKPAQEIFNLFFDSELTNLFETGKIRPADFYLQVKELLNLKIAYRQFVLLWNDIFFLTPKNYAVYYLAKKLKNRYATLLLSNINVLHFDYLKKNFPVFDAFHKLFTSFKLGLRKPDPRIYQKTLEILSLRPQEVFYTDDRPELVASATLLGLPSVVFKSIAGLEKDLQNSGIDIH